MKSTKPNLLFVVMPISRHVKSSRIREIVLRTHPDHVYLILDRSGCVELDHQDRSRCSVLRADEILSQLSKYGINLKSDHLRNDAVCAAAISKRNLGISSVRNLAELYLSERLSAETKAKADILYLDDDIMPPVSGVAPLQRDAAMARYGACIGQPPFPFLWKADGVSDKQIREINRVLFPSFTRTKDEIDMIVDETLNSGRFDHSAWHGSDCESKSFYMGGCVLRRASSLGIPLCPPIPVIGADDIFSSAICIAYGMTIRFHPRVAFMHAKRDLQIRDIPRVLISHSRFNDLLEIREWLLNDGPKALFELCYRLRQDYYEQRRVVRVSQFMRKIQQSEVLRRIALPSPSECVNANTNALDRFFSWLADWHLKLMSCT